MKEEEFARALLAHERKEWQDPDKILAQIGIKKDMTVVDLACGPGFFTMPIAQAVGQSGRVYAVDSSKVMLKYLRSNMNRYDIGGKTVEIVEADVTKSHIPSETADIVLFANVLHDLGSKKKFLKEVKRISKNTGLAVDIDWKKAENGFGPPLEIRLSEYEARVILADSGYDVTKRIDAGPYHYGLVCKILKQPTV